MCLLSELQRIAVSFGIPKSILDRGASLRSTRFLACAAIKSRFGGRPFQMVNIGGCNGVLFDDATPWLHRIKGSKAVPLV